MSERLNEIRNELRCLRAQRSHWSKIEGDYARAMGLKCEVRIKELVSERERLKGEVRDGKIKDVLRELREYL